MACCVCGVRHRPLDDLRFHGSLAMLSPVQYCGRKQCGLPEPAQTDKTLAGRDPVLHQTHAQEIPCPRATPALDPRTVLFRSGCRNNLLDLCDSRPRPTSWPTGSRGRGTRLNFLHFLCVHDRKLLPNSIAGQDGGFVSGKVHIPRVSPSGPFCTDESHLDGHTYNGGPCGVR